MGLRPRTINVALRANGVTIEWVRLNAANGWTWAIRNLPVEDEKGRPINYTWYEPEIEYYTEDGHSTSAKTTTIENRGPGGDDLIPNPENNLGPVFINVGDCLE